MRCARVARPGLAQPAHSVGPCRDRCSITKLKNQHACIFKTKCTLVRPCQCRHQPQPTSEYLSLESVFLWHEP